MGTNQDENLVVEGQPQIQPQMQTELHSTFQLAGIALTVRDDINVLVREYGGLPTYIIEDELTSSFYRIGQAEYTFLSLLDGKTTFAAALGRTAALMKADALTEERAASFCKWLVQCSLASTEQSRSVTRLVDHSARADQQKARGRFSVLSQKVPLLYPKSLTEVLGRLLGWLFSVPVVLLWLVLIAVGGFILRTDWQQFTSSASTVISRDNWLWLMATWLGLKIVHETAHAVACRRYGGTVREAGIQFIVFFPLPYVDVTSAWRFASRWQRIVTSAAGMYAELAVAAVATIIWSRTAPGLVHQNAYNIIVSAGLMTVLFNANPLMRFDGYYILTDLLEMPNLYTHGQHALKQLGRRWGLGLSAQAGIYPEGHSGLVLAYGCAAFVWRIAICVGLILAADALLFGLGTLLAVTAVFLWALFPLFRILKFVAFGNDYEHPSRVRFGTLTLTLGVLCWGTMTVVPWYSTASAPLVVDFYPQVEVRSAVSGFIQQLNVCSGQQVQAGQTLVILENQELITRAKVLELDLALSRRRAGGYLQRHEVSAVQVEYETLAALEERFSALTKQLNALEVKAPEDGVVLTERLDDRHGEWLTAGSLVLTIGPAQEKELLALVDQSQSDVFRARVGSPIKIHVAGTGTRWTASHLTSIAEKASRQIPHPALAANAGGPLDVRTRGEGTAELSSEQQRFELLEPHFLVRADIPRQLQASLSAGQTGTVAFLTQDGSVGGHLSRVAHHWWNKRQEAIQRQIYRR